MEKDKLFDIFVQIETGTQNLDLVHFSDPTSSSPDDTYDEDDDIQYVDTDDEFMYHLHDSQDSQKNKIQKEEINEINTRLKQYYDNFSKYCKVEKITKDKFLKIRDSFSDQKKQYNVYIEELKDRIILDPDNPVIEECPFVLDIPIIKTHIESINKLVKIIEDTYSQIYIYKIMNK